MWMAIVKDAALKSRQSGWFYISESTSYTGSEDKLSDILIYSNLKIWIATVSKSF